MGFGFGGEWAAGAVLMGEVIRARHRGKAVGFVQSGWSIGWAVAAVLSTSLFTAFPQDIAWRNSVLGWLGPIIHCPFLRRFVEDPPVFKAAREKIAAGGLRQRPFEIFSPELIRTTILTCLLATGAQGGYSGALHMVADISQGRTQALCDRQVVIVGSFIGHLVSAHLADSIGRRANFLIYAVSSVGGSWQQT